MLGILRAIGAYVPEPGSVMWTLFMLIQRTFAIVFGAQGCVQHPAMLSRCALPCIVRSMLCWCRAPRPVHGDQAGLR